MCMPVHVFVNTHFCACMSVCLVHVMNICMCVFVFVSLHRLMNILERSCSCTNVCTFAFLILFMLSYFCPCLCMCSVCVCVCVCVCVVCLLHVCVSMSLAACCSATWLEYHQAMRSLSPFSCGKPLLVLQWLTHTHTQTHTHTHTHTWQWCVVTLGYSSATEESKWNESASFYTGDTMFLRCYYYYYYNYYYYYYCASVQRTRVKPCSLKRFRDYNQYTSK